MGFLENHNHLGKNSVTYDLISKGTFKDDPFVLADVGCSGGIGSEWDIWDDQIKVFGFDPLTAEMKRLSQVNEYRPNYEFHAAFVVGPKDQAPLDVSDADQFFCRSSAQLGANLTKNNHIQDHYNAGATIEYTSTKVTLDGFFSKREVKPNLIKIDTDGHDIEVLKGADKVLNNLSTLGLIVECPFQGLPGPDSNSLGNIEQYLRSKGFLIFDLSVWRYSKATLPHPFVYDFFGQTTKGKACWGDVLFLRDYANPYYKKYWTKENPDSATLLKLLCLFELFQLEDCAAELLMTFQDQFSTQIDVQLILDKITANLGLATNYADHMNTFKKDPKSFFRSRQTTPTPAPEITSVMAQLKRAVPKRIKSKLKEFIQTRS